VKELLQIYSLSLLHFVFVGHTWRWEANSCEGATSRIWSRNEWFREWNCNNIHCKA